MKRFCHAPRADKILKPAFGGRCTTSPCRKTSPTSRKSRGQNIHPLFLVRCGKALLAIHHCQCLTFQAASPETCLTEALPLPLLPICSAGWLFSTLELECSIPALLPLTGKHEIFTKNISSDLYYFYLSLPRLLKITYFHLDTQLPLGTNLSVIHTSLLPTSLISSNHFYLNLPSLSA